MESILNEKKKKKVSSSSRYKGYNSKTLGDNYDYVTQKIRDMVSDCGGVIDIKSEIEGKGGSTREINGVRAKFSNKDDRDEFNRKKDKLDKEKKKKKNKDKDKDDDFGKAKTQKEINKDLKKKEKEKKKKSLSEIIFNKNLQKLIKESVDLSLKKYLNI